MSSHVLFCLFVLVWEFRCDGWTVSVMCIRWTSYTQHKHSQNACTNNINMTLMSTRPMHNIHMIRIENHMPTQRRVHPATHNNHVLAEVSRTVFRLGSKHFAIQIRLAVCLTGDHEVPRRARARAGNVSSVMAPTLPFPPT